MQHTVVITPEAEAQIMELHKYLSVNAGSVIADGYTNALLDYLEGFSIFPERGNSRNDIRDGLRVTHFRHRTVIAYAVDTPDVFIVGIYHDGRDYENITW